jgi:hypothetical protein
VPGGLINGYVQYGLIDVDPTDLATVDHVEMHAKDRHVLVAASSADADILPMENTEHIPRDWMATNTMGARLDSPPIADRRRSSSFDLLTACSVLSIRTTGPVG